MNVVYRACVLLAGIVLASCAGAGGSGGQSAAVSLTPGSFSQLAGWSEDRVANALPAFDKSCERLTAQQSASAPLDPSATDANFGAVRDWQPLCRQAAALPRGDEAA